jgi:hypothetical protein
VPLDSCEGGSVRRKEGTLCAIGAIFFTDARFGRNSVVVRVWVGFEFWCI